MSQVILERSAFDRLFQALHRHDYQVIGPTVENGAIVYRPIESSADLPAGWGDLQDNATYRLQERNDEALFGYALAPQSWKQYLFPASTRLWEAQREPDGGFVVTEDGPDGRYAFLGMRACEIAAVEIQDRVLMSGSFVDPHYRRMREAALFIGVNCTDPAGTCFCVSMDTGPAITGGYDLMMTEVLEGGHRFVVEAGTSAGHELLTELDLPSAGSEDVQAARARVDAAVNLMGREMDTTDIRDLLYRNYTSRQWDEVAQRCLACTNCTMVCPTCFCNTVTDVSGLNGETAARDRSWDSCFTMEFSYIHGGSLRTSHKARYRQWMTHKLAAWIDQFGSSGCVGCGRCITWCPAGIDITHEVRSIRAADEGVAHVR